MLRDIQQFPHAEFLNGQPGLEAVSGLAAGLAGEHKPVGAPVAAKAEMKNRDQSISSGGRTFDAGKVESKEQKTQKSRRGDGR